MLQISGNNLRLSFIRKTLWWYFELNTFNLVIFDKYLWKLWQLFKLFAISLFTRKYKSPSEALQYRFIFDNFLNSNNNFSIIYWQMSKKRCFQNVMSGMCWEEKNYYDVINKVSKWLFKYFWKKYRSSHVRCSIKKLSFWKLCKIHRTDRKTPVSESLCNSEYWEIFNSTYFEEHLRTAASENVFMKLRRIGNYS